MDDKKWIHAIAIGLICFILVAGTFAPQEQQATLYVSSFGFLALLTIIFVLAIPVLVQFNKSAFFLKALANRRWIGIYSFIFAFIHILLVLHFFFNWDISQIQLIPFGVATFAILIVLTATSNDWAVKILGRNWKKLQMLTYLALLLALVHFVSNGQIFAKEIAIVAIVLLIVAVVLILKWKPKK